MRNLPFAMLWLLLAAPWSAVANPDAEESEPHPCRAHSPSPDDMLDNARQGLHHSLCIAALWLDGISGDKGSLIAARQSRGRIETSHTYSQFSGNKLRVRADVRVELPVLKRRLSAFIGRGDQDEVVEDRAEGFGLRSEFPDIGDNDDWLAGLGYSLPSSRRFRSEFRVGARSLSDPRVFVQQRMQYAAYSDYSNTVHLRETLFWTNEDGFGSTTGFDCMHVMHNGLLLRWDSVGTITQETVGVRWRTALILYQNLGRGRAVAYESFWRGESRRQVPVSEYGLRAVVRQPIFSRRLILNYRLGYTWPQTDPAVPREGSLGVGFGLEMPFGPAADRDS